MLAEAAVRGEDGLHYFGRECETLARDEEGALRRERVGRNLLQDARLVRVNLLLDLDAVEAVLESGLVVLYELDLALGRGVAAARFR